MSIIITPEEEFALIMYIVNYDECNNWVYRTIHDLILRLNNRRTTIVYRGQSEYTIRTNTYFFSTTPMIQMAKEFQPKDWSYPNVPRLCCLFKIHLMDVPVLSTKCIKYTYSSAVQKMYREYSNMAMLKPWNRVPYYIRQLVYSNQPDNREEIIVINGGSFYNSENLSTIGFKKVEEDIRETWYCYK